MKKPTRTISGVAPVSVMLPPRKCPHGICTYCPSLDAPQSYTPESPVPLRAKKLNYSAYMQVYSRIKTFEKMGHPTEKVELIIMGGTFLSYPEKFQYNFVKECYDAMNGRKSKSLNEAKKLNESSKIRCVALCIETRPDFCSKELIKRMLDFGCTRVELGVQNPDNSIYKLTKRGHSVKDVINATLRLKQAGFKVGYHLMPGLPGSNFKKDLKMFKKIFKSSNFKPDQIKIYPCQVISGAELEKDFINGKYKPYDEESFKNLLIKIYPIVPAYCRVMRIMREVPSKYLIAGIKSLNLREMVEREIRLKNLKINEIRFREIGFNNKGIPKKIKIKVIKYRASKANEFFIQVVDESNLLYGLLRLRIGKGENSSMIRELHVYGPALEIGKKDSMKFQHQGLGKQLLIKAEGLSKKYKCKKINIISGVGVRDYYKKFGYYLDGNYMSKEI